jgi:hypothetical protein
MKSLYLWLVATLLVACAQMQPAPMLDAGNASDAAPAATDANRPPNAIPAYGHDALCPTAISRNEELGCGNMFPSVTTCPQQWDGNEYCDEQRGPTCLDQLAGATDCYELVFTWRGCLSACTPTPP